MTSALATRTEPSRAALPVFRKKPANHVGLVALLCGLLAFALAIVNNILLSDAPSRQIFDSCHYIQTSQELYLWVKDLLFGTNLSVGNETLGSMLLIDGPILPVCGAVTAAMLGTAPSISAYHLLMLFQAAMHALTAALVVVLAHRWLRSRLWLSALAGIIWALYPGALAGSGMFLTETLTTALTVWLIWLTTKSSPLSYARNANPSPVIRTIALGFTVACIALLKPPLIPLAVALLALHWTARRNLRVPPTALAFIAGIAIALTPWIAFTKYATGKAQVLPQRVPSVNLAVGNDVELDGWHTLPLPPLTMLEILQSPPQIISSLGRTHGYELVPLTFRKVARLWAQPWIPSQRDVLGVAYDIQCKLHQFIIAFSLPAILFVLAMTRLKRGMPQRRLLSTALCLVLGVHFLYLPFETVNRYALPAMPAVILILICATAEMARRKAFRSATIIGAASCLSLFLCWQIDLLPWLSGTVSNPAVITIVDSAIALLLLLAIASSVWRHANSTITSKLHRMRIAGCLAVLWFLAAGVAFASIEPGVPLPEWKTRLTDDATAAVRTIESIPTIDWSNVAGAYVLVDSDKNITSANVTVNGVSVGTPRRAHEVCDFQYKSTVEEFLKICARCRNLKPEDMRNWWLAPVELYALSKQAGQVELKVAAKPQAPVTIQGHYVRDGQKELLIPHLHYLGFSKLESSEDRIEYRHTDRFHRRATKAMCNLQSNTTQNATASTREKSPSDLSTEPGIQTGEYRLYLLIAYKVPPESIATRDKSAWLYPDHQLWSIW